MRNLGIKLHKIMDHILVLKIAFHENENNEYNSVACKDAQNDRPPHSNPFGDKDIYQ